MNFSSCHINCCAGSHSSTRCRSVTSELRPNSTDFGRSSSDRSDSPSCAHLDHNVGFKMCEHTIKSYSQMSNSHFSTTQSAAIPATSQLSFAQIEELINKYTLELEEQEKTFINQATQVNTWDNLLNNNSNKVSFIHRPLLQCLPFIDLVFYRHRLSNSITPLKK